MCLQAAARLMLKFGLFMAFCWIFSQKKSLMYKLNPLRQTVESSKLLFLVLVKNSWQRRLWFDLNGGLTVINGSQALK